MKTRIFAAVLSLMLLLMLVLCACETTPPTVEESGDDSSLELPGEELPEENIPASGEEQGQENAAEQENIEEKEYRTSFFATGDNLIHTGIWRQANRNAGESGNDCLMDSPYDFSPFYESIAPMVEEADLAFLNQETLVAANENGVPQNYPSFNTPRACGDTMIELGFDIVNVANNHMMDMSSQGLKNSIDYWRAKTEITQVGAYLDEEDYNDIRVVEKNGIRIAFLAYVEDANNSGRGLQTPLSAYHNYSSLGLYIPALNEQELRRQVADAKEIADFVVVAVHWGTENSYTVNSVQTHFASVCAELGVDLVLGSHPHVLQRMEWMPSESSSGKTLVVYSLGNMISLMESSEGNLLGGALTLDFVKNGEETRIENVVMTPIVTHCSASYREIAIYLLKDYTQEIYASHYIHSHCSTTVSDFARIMCEQIPQEFWGECDYSVS